MQRLQGRVHGLGGPGAGRPRDRRRRCGRIARTPGRRGEIEQHLRAATDLAHCSATQHSNTEGKKKKKKKQISSVARACTCQSVQKETSAAKCTNRLHLG